MSGNSFQDPLAHLQTAVESIFENVRELYGDQFADNAKKNSKSCLVCHVKANLVAAMTYSDASVNKSFIAVFGLCRECDETTDPKSLMKYVARKQANGTR